MVIKVSDSIIIKIDADIEDARRKFAQLRNEAEGTAATVQRSFRKIADTAGKGSAQNTAKSRSLAADRQISLPGQSFNVIQASLFGPAVQIVTTIIEAVNLAAKGASKLARNALNLQSALEKENRRIEEQIKELRQAKGLIDPVDEQEQATRRVLDEQIKKLEGFQRLREDMLDRISSVESNIKEQIILGGEAANLDVRTEFETLFRQIANTDRNIDSLKTNILKIEQALEEPVQKSELLEAFTGLPESLNQLGGRIDDLVRELQDIAGDAAAQSQELLDAVTELGDALGGLCECIGGGRPPPPDDDPDPSRPDESEPDASRDGGRFTLASFDPADSPFGGGGRDGFNRELADTAWQVQDLSAGFVELTDAAGDFEVQGASLAELLGQTNALFGEQSGLLGTLAAQVPELGGAFATLLERTSQEVETLDDAVEVLGQSFLSAFEGAIQSGESLSDVLKGLALDLAEIALKTAGNAVLDAILGGLGPGPLPDPASFAESFTLLTAKGAAFEPGGVLAQNIKEFARGGIVDTPEAFAFADGLGIMGEAGPEAILPLARTPSGALGVKTAKRLRRTLPEVRRMHERTATKSTIRFYGLSRCSKSLSCDSIRPCH